MKSLILLLFCCITAAGLKAQTRAQAAAEINAYREKLTRAFEVFLDASNAETVRLSAVANYAMPVDVKQLVRCAETARNTRESDMIRAAALTKTYAYAGKDEALFSGVIKWVKDKERPELSKASLNTLTLLHFGEPVSSSIGMEITKVMQELTANTNAEYRYTAFAVLSRQQDPFALEQILKGLSALDSSRLPVEQGLALLNNYHKKTDDAYRVVYGVYNKQISQQSRIECIRLLGTYKPAEEAIITIFQNQRETPLVRMAALNTLQASLQKEKLETVIRPVVFNENDNEALRVVALKQIMYIKQANQERSRNRKPGRFSDDVEKLAQTSASPLVKETANNYVFNVNAKY
jgi:hypothetical protein